VLQRCQSQRDNQDKITGQRIAGLKHLQRERESKKETEKKQQQKPYCQQEKDKNKTRC
jgi:hypothetical protein